MLLTEYDYDTDIAVQRQEAYESGISQGAQQKAIETAKILLLKNISVDIISECTGLSVDEIKGLTK